MHLSSNIALDLGEGRLTVEENAFWRSHLELCKECTAEMGRWREFQIDVKRSHLMSAPEESVKSAMLISSAGPQESGPSTRYAVAALIFDSFLEPALAGARGTSATARQLVMRAEQFDIHLKIWGEREHRQMLGQVLPRGGADFVPSARFHLLQNGERLETAAVDETGEFHFTELPEGDLSLQIDLPHLTVIGALNFKELH